MSVSRQTLLRLADGRNLDVRVSGPADGKVLVFHHGTPGSGLTIRAISDAANRLGLRLVTISRPGYGDSTRQAGRSVSDVAADTAAVLNYVGVGRCLVAGWSGGGPHALACGARLSQRVAAVVVFAGVAPYPADGLEWVAGMGEDNVAEFGAAGQGEAALRPLLEGQRPILQQATPAELIAGLSSILAPADKQVLSGKFGDDFVANLREGLRVGLDGWLDDDLAFMRPWGFAVSEVAVPTILWQGTEDRMVPLSHAEWLAQRIPGVVAHIEYGEGHLLFAGGSLDQLLQELVDVSRARL